ncbi:hypothetical protein [Salinifilum ghardaiensis]
MDRSSFQRWALESLAEVEPGSSKSAVLRAASEEAERPAATPAHRASSRGRADAALRAALTL